MANRKCFPPPKNVTFAYSAYNAREESVYKSTLDELIAGVVSRRSVDLALASSQ
jgi:hypothetical protein